MGKQNYNEIEVKNNMKVEESADEVQPTTDKKDLKQVVTVVPTKVKRNLLSRLVSGVLGPDGLPGIGEYVNDEIIKPAIKNIIVDAVTSGINMVMYGDSKHGHRGQGINSRPSNQYSRPATNYSSRYTSQPAEPAERRARPSRYGVDDYTIDERFDASHVLTTLTEAADMYGSVSVADYYDLIGVPSQYTDNQYGWTIDTITHAVITPVRAGYIIKFPTVEVI